MKTIFLKKLIDNTNLMVIFKLNTFLNMKINFYLYCYKNLFTDLKRNVNTELLFDLHSVNLIP